MPTHARPNPPTPNPATSSPSMHPFQFGKLLPVEACAVDLQTTASREISHSWGVYLLALVVRELRGHGVVDTAKIDGVAGVSGSERFRILY
ncbi:unnamed protein product [Cercopithifilaria johnstoni]|uniref:Uncharacterized protein n=1 Tax=Cercopithifilaria johnstoni TaxID=2874296 RepID=A0A8J2LWH4_9BILA|nr:unnamed protein product [Cercopithifilaria johnstoni]